MGRGKSSPLLIIIVLLALLCFLNPFRLLPAFAKLLLKGAVAVAALIGILVVLVLYFALRKKKPDEKTEEKQLNDALSAKGRQRVVQLRSLAMNIKNNDIRQQAEEICRSVSEMLAVSDTTDRAINTDRFIENHLTALGSVLTKFARMEANGTLTDDILNSAQDCLDRIKQAAEARRQKEQSAEIMDIAVEMEILLTMCKRDGLLAEEGFSFSQESGGINLVL